MHSARSFLHPFPARMAPELALNEIKKFKSPARILDPMVGSGTVALSAVATGHFFYGRDLDPLAQIISTVSTSNIDYAELRSLAKAILIKASKCSRIPTDLPWIETGDETHQFIEFWFAEKQRAELASIAFEINELRSTSHSLNVQALEVALSRLIVTKESKASLARDTSHSRPHRVSLTNDFNVISAFERSVDEVIKRHSRFSRLGTANIALGDARKLDQLADGEIDAIVTSPPYLNAIDYMRGHRMSLVWLGHTIPSLRMIRSTSVGAERATAATRESINAVLDCFGDISGLADRQQSMIRRYAVDLIDLLAEAGRVTKSGGSALYVIGNSRLKGTYVDNAAALACAAQLAGFNLRRRVEREIPPSSRYLPIPKNDNSLAARMRVETVLSFDKVA